jgi:hypothetical protein
VHTRAFRDFVSRHFVISSSAVAQAQAPLRQPAKSPGIRGAHEFFIPSSLRALVQPQIHILICDCRHPQNLFPTSNSLDTKTQYTIADRRVPPTRATQGKFSPALSPNWVCALGSGPVWAYQTGARRLLAPTLPFRMISALWNWR